MNAVTEVMDELRKALAELEDCRARNADLRTMLEQVTRERDVETNSALMFECDWKDACRERDEARAERDAAIARITEVGVMVATNGNELAKDAYRRGAEAMREACASAFAEYEGAGLSAQILAMELPIPEEP